MAFIRMTSEREFSKGSGLYIYPFDNKGEATIAGFSLAKSDELEENLIRTEDFCEIMFRVLRRSGLAYGCDTINAIRKDLHLPPLE